MRMNTSTGITAAEWLAEASESDIVRVLKDYGEERFARRIARHLLAARAVDPIVTTVQLANLVQQAMPMVEKHKHPATRTFQAIRIHINQELSELEQGLEQIVRVLKPTGRLVVIAFHSLEDRIVKRFIRDEARGGIVPKSLPMAAPGLEPRLKRMGKALRANEQEVAQNPRARSAILRVAQRLA
jgi:16S rRNA (cytosine1402-N4)-methyltransferase